MHALTTATVAGSPWEAPAPVLFNTWKHHAGFLRQRIAGCAGRAEPALGELAGELVVVGTTQMDLYVGVSPPAEIGQLILAQLGRDGVLEPAAYHDWVEQGGGYRVVTLPDDCNWVLRAGEENGRYVHVHPGRWAPQTRRVRANVLRTAVLALAAAGGGDPLELANINRVRRDFLGLAPIGKLRGEQGLSEVIELLRGP